ncbi:MAG: hypothetical protein CME68_05170 [Halobacteriovoraceae bacterium]|nr:hypothetical protein [Halobacteriovoraceae bacterium]
MTFLRKVFMNKNDYLQLKEKVKRLKNSDLIALWWLVRASLLTITWLYLLLSNHNILNILGIPLGVAVVFNWVSILHDCGHGHFFSKNWMNTIVGLTASIFSLLPFEQWRTIHNLHHRWTGYFDKDPTASGPNKTMIKENQRKVVDFAWKYWVPIFVISFYVRSFWNPFFTLQFSPTIKKKALQLFCLLFMIMPYIILCYFFGMNFLIPFLLSTFFTLFISDPFLLSQHTYFERKYYNEEDSHPTIPPRKQDEYTREIIFPPFISNFVFMNFNFHVLHHFFPSLPAYHLPGLIKWTPKATNRQNWTTWVIEAKKIQGHKLLMSHGVITP